MNPRRPRRAGRTVFATALLLTGAGFVSAQPADRIAVPDVDVTPVNLCASGTTRFIGANRELPLPGLRYCTDSDWRVHNVERDNRNLYWEVPFANGVVRCSCRRR